MNRRRLLLIMLFVLAISALYLSALAPMADGAERARPASDSLAFAARGPHAVGMRSLAIDGDRPVKLTLWYPALAQGSGDTTTYPYELKVIPLLGANTIAAYGGQAVRNAPADLSASPYPLIILSPGFAIGSATYGWLAEHLASHGFVVLAPEHEEYLFTAMSELWRSALTRPQSIATVMAYVGRQMETGGHLVGLVDGQRVAVIGHSYGGYTALAAGGAQLHTTGFEARCQKTYEVEDPAAWLCDALLPHIGDMAQVAGLEAVPEGLWPARTAGDVDAVVSMAGDAYLFDEAGLAQISVPLMAIGGTLDGDTPYTWGTHPTYAFASSPKKARIALQGAEHMVFAGPCHSIRRFMELAPNNFCSEPHWDRDEAHDVVRHFVTAFLLAELVQDQEATAALAPDTVDIPGVSYAAQGY